MFEISVVIYDAVVYNTDTQNADIHSIFSFLFFSFNLQHHHSIDDFFSLWHLICFYCWFPHSTGNNISYFNWTVGIFSLWYENSENPGYQTLLLPKNVFSPKKIGRFFEEIGIVVWVKKVCHIVIWSVEYLRGNASCFVFVCMIHTCDGF